MFESDLNETNLKESFPSFSFKAMKEMNCKNVKNFEAYVCESFSSNEFTLVFKRGMINQDCFRIGVSPKVSNGLSFVVVSAKILSKWVLTL